MLINPIWFYLIEVVDTLDYLFFVSAIIIFCMVTVLALVSLIDYDSLKKEEINKIINFGKKISIFGFISCVLCCFLPSKQTCYEMMVASLITQENFNYTKEQGKELTNYILETVDALMDNINKER